MKLQKLIAAGMCAAVMMSGTLLRASAAKERTLYYGDVDRDGTVGVSDIIQLQKTLLGISPLRSANAALCADLTRDGTIDVFDLAMLKRYVVQEILLPVETEPAPTEATTEAPTTEPPTDPPTEPPTDPATDPPTEPPTDPATDPPTEPATDPSGSSEFISAPIYDLYGSMPSQGTAKMVVFYVDFPDCPYDFEPDTALIENAVFGTAENPSDPNYPFESMHNFFSRASKGTLELTGSVYRYTTKENKAYYEVCEQDGELVTDESKVRLVEELYQAFNKSVNFADFDADQDGYVDATLINVPTAAGDDNWWPCAGEFSEYYHADKTYVGHVIVGNAQIVSADDYQNFVSSYCHETGHCMGLADYYLYHSTDYIGFHGTAGVDLMDVDAYSDLDCFSKLMLGWYRENQIQVYDQSAGGSQSFLLHNAQTDSGNCLILPCGELQNGYFSEYMIVEYISEDGNNSGINTVYGWEPAKLEPGVRVFHVYADVSDNGWWKYFTYENGSDETNEDDDGIRLIRLVNDAEGGAPFRTGDVIDGNLSGFHWYDANEGETVDTGYSISVGELADGSYTVTVTAS